MTYSQWIIGASDIKRLFSSVQTLPMRLIDFLFIWRVLNIEETAIHTFNKKISILFDEWTTFLTVAVITTYSFQSSPRNNVRIAL